MIFIFKFPISIGFINKTCCKNGWLLPLYSNYINNDNKIKAVNPRRTVSNHQGQRYQGVREGRLSAD